MLNNTCSKRAFAFVYDSNASEWLDACDTRANEENRARSSIQAGARKAGSLEHPPRARERERERETEKRIDLGTDDTDQKKRRIHTDDDDDDDDDDEDDDDDCLLYTSPSPRDKRQSRMPSSA